MKNKNRSILLSLRLFAIMFKIGLFTFGGGYSMINILEREFVEKNKWLDGEEFLDIITISQSTPGPIAINAATYIGYRIYGFFGSLLATVAVCVPSFVIIFMISLFYDEFLSIKTVDAAFKGIQSCVVFLIISAGIRMFKKLNKTKSSYILFSLTVIIFCVFSYLGIVFSTVYYIIAGACIGIVIYFVNTYLTARNKNKGEKSV